MGPRDAAAALFAVTACRALLSFAAALDFAKAADIRNGAVSAKPAARPSGPAEPADVDTPRAALSNFSGVVLSAAAPPRLGNEAVLSMPLTPAMKKLVTDAAAAAGTLTKSLEVLNVPIG